jgi:hypothetical protein
MAFHDSHEQISGDLIVQVAMPHKSEISLSPDWSGQDRTGVAVHEVLLDSVMTAPLKQRESLLEQPHPMHGLNVDQSWQSENLDA